MKSYFVRNNKGKLYHNNVCFYRVLIFFMNSFEEFILIYLRVLLYSSLFVSHPIEFNPRHVSRKTARYWTYCPLRFSELRLDIEPSVKTFSKSRFVKQKFLENFVLSLVLWKCFLFISLILFWKKIFCFWKIFPSLVSSKIVLSLIFGKKYFFFEKFFQVSFLLEKFVKIFLSLLLHLIKIETHLHTFSYMVCAYDYCPKVMVINGGFTP